MAPYGVHAHTIENGGNYERERPRAPPSRLFLQDELPKTEDLDRTCLQKFEKHNCLLASRVENNIPVYDATCLNMNDERLLDEWNYVLLSGPGVFILQNMYPDLSVIEKANEAFANIISREKAGAKGDHFSAGQNERIWNSFSKHCLEDPASFVEYYSNPWLARICEAWLGPCFRVTAQCNIVKARGEAQVSHRDYHLGFQTEEACSRFPRATQVASQLLTLQGAVAHTDMPLESGPTRFLPFSQQIESGFMVYRRPEFSEYFSHNYVSFPLKCGDAVFFNPALMHAAGANETSDFDRSANLLQVSSAMGKTMEYIDSIPLVEACWENVSRQFHTRGWSKSVETLVAILGEGYPFPTNLDRRPPEPGGMAPESEQDILKRGLKLGWNTEDVIGALKQIREESRPSK